MHREDASVEGLRDLRNEDRPQNLRKGGYNCNTIDAYNDINERARLLCVLACQPNRPHIMRPGIPVLCFFQIALRKSVNCVITVDGGDRPCFAVHRTVEFGTKAPIRTCSLDGHIREPVNRHRKGLA